MRNPFKRYLVENKVVARILPKTITSEGRRGGICLDFYKKIPEEYKDQLHIGKNVMIKSGTILCGEGFHFKRTIDDKLVFTEHRHGVQIGDDVWIGSNCTVDRGRIRDTIIGEGTKIDNGVHISHNVVIGKNCIIGQGATILGSVTIGDNCEIWSNSVIHQGVVVGKGAVVGANTYLRHDLPPNMAAFPGNCKVIEKDLSDTKKYRGGSKKTNCLNGKCERDSSW